MSRMNTSGRLMIRFHVSRKSTERIASLSLKKARALLLPSPKDDFDLSAAIAELSEERTALLQIHGYPPDYLELKYDCPFCKDTGYVENQKCSCLRKPL